MMFKVNKLDLNKLGTDINKLADNYVETIKSIEVTIKEIDTLLLWDGIDEKSYMERIDEKYIPTLKKIETELYDYADYLVKTSEAYVSVESYLGNKEIDI